MQETAQTVRNSQIPQAPVSRLGPSSSWENSVWGLPGLSSLRVLVTTQFFFVVFKTVSLCCRNHVDQVHLKVPEVWLPALNVGDRACVTRSRNAVFCAAPSWELL